jgi:hypothetical protein
MDKELFKQKLSEVAEWRIPKTITSTKDGEPKRPRGRPTAEELYQREHETVFTEMFDGVNPTYPPQLLKIKTQGCACEDCGDQCPNGRHIEKKLYDTGGKKNWRERCLTCSKSRNPFTGKFDISSSQAPFVWTDFLKNRKGVYKTKNNQAREDAGIITFYPDGKPRE